MEPLLLPFRAWRPASGRAQDVVAPPYDVVSTAEARARAAGRPWSFLHVSRAEIDLAPGIDPYAPEVYAKAGDAFRRMVDAGVLVREDRDAFYVYRLTAGDHVQTGIAAAAPVVAYTTSRIRRHEHTRPAKEMDRVRQIAAVGAHTGPVFLTHRPDAEIAAAIADVTGGEPSTDVMTDERVRHQIWIVDDPAVVQRLIAAFAGMAAIYVADGHHRAAAAARVAELRASGEDRFLVVTFPADEVRILDYNRLVRDLAGHSPDQLRHRLSDAFEVQSLSSPPKPTRPGEFAMVLEGLWYRLRLRATEGESEAVDRLDVSRLSRHVLEPILGIGDPRTDPRIDFVGGDRGLAELARRVAAGDWAVGFGLYPTALADLMAVADAGAVMPPKSTWFDPKLADGLLSLPLD
ncbi:MAG: DUF1015 domain-containing protein [Rhodospirillales bacterium]|nr:MAG: DUF1015 domain-containing protein [Rhodospirillales bacterium]